MKLIFYFINFVTKKILIFFVNFIEHLHKPTYKCRVTVGDLVADGGEGRSKKKAKHAAAKSMLDKLFVYNKNH